MKNKALLWGILLIVVGFLIIFFFGFKDNNFLEIISYLTFFSGWMIITFTIFGKYYTDQKPKFTSHKLIWIRKTFKNIAIISFAVIGLFASVIISGKLADNRIQNILHNEPTDKTIAEVINLESRHTRGGWKIWAIFKYKTSENKTYEKGIFNYKNYFKKGNQYKIIYSIKHPEIIQIESKFE